MTNNIYLSIKILSDLMSDVTEQRNENSESPLLNLPLTALENIINHLKYFDILKFSCTCKYIRALCAGKVRSELKQLKRTICNEIRRKDEDGANLRAREVNLKYKYLLRILQTEISLLLIIYRQNLHVHSVCLSLGEVISDFRQILQKIRTRSLKSWSDIKKNKKIIQKKVTYHIGNLVRDGISLPSLGIQISDLLDITINSKYEILATYNIKLRTCEIKAKYEIENMKIINFLPDLSVIRCNDHRLAYNERSLIINFFALMIKIHNYFMIQDEHYQKRMKLYQREYNDDYEDEFLQLNSYPRKERITITDDEVKELYKNVDDLNYSGKGLWIEIDLKCSINEAPVRIIKNWEQIVAEIGKIYNLNSSNASLTPFNMYNIFIKFKKYLSESLNCITIVQK